MDASATNASVHNTPQFFTWTPEEAKSKARLQSAASNCGATALLNVLLALGVPLPDIQAIDGAVCTRSRKHGVGVAEYLAARSVAGCTGEDIVHGCEEVAGDSVESKFFPLNPRRNVDLQAWLSNWLKMGCSAIATLNMQAIADTDYWHHQMIYGVDADGVHMTNGDECLDFDEIRPGLDSASLLQVRVDDALACSPFNAQKCDALGDEWAKLCVTRQMLQAQNGRSKAEHIFIPAAYRAGITIFALKGSPAADLLRSTPELPLQEGNCGKVFRKTVASSMGSLPNYLSLGVRAPCRCAGKALSFCKEVSARIQLFRRSALPQDEGSNQHSGLVV